MQWLGRWAAQSWFTGVVSQRRIRASIERGVEGPGAAFRVRALSNAGLGIEVLLLMREETLWQLDAVSACDGKHGSLTEPAI